MMLVDVRSHLQIPGKREQVCDNTVNLHPTADPLSCMAPLNKPVSPSLPAYASTWAMTLTEPADSPQMVTLFGSDER